jgi:ribosomal protein L40E
MAVKICKSCGESNAESAVFCVVCSSSLKDAPLEGTLNADKQYTGILTGFSRQRCWYCDEKLEDGALKCKYCGSTVLRPSIRKSYGGSSYSSGTTDGCAVFLLFAATFLIPIVGLIVGGIFAFSEDSNKQDIGKALLVFGLVLIVIGFIVGMFIL